jgi:hypothetical protein
MIVDDFKDIANRMSTIDVDGSPTLEIDGIKVTFFTTEVEPSAVGIGNCYPYRDWDSFIALFMNEVPHRDWDFFTALFVNEVKEEE